MWIKFLTEFPLKYFRAQIKKEKEKMKLSCKIFLPPGNWNCFDDCSGPLWHLQHCSHFVAFCLFPRFFHHRFWQIQVVKLFYDPEIWVSTFYHIKSETKKRDTFKNWLLKKNPQFLSYPHKTWWKWFPCEIISLKYVPFFFLTLKQKFEAWFRRRFCLRSVARL